VCSEQTHGIFNAAKVIQEKIDAREALKEAEKADKEQSEEEIIAEYMLSKAKAERRGNASGWSII